VFISGALGPSEINSLRQYALVFFPALISGRLFDTGHLRVPLVIASVNLVLCTLLIAECHEYWQFLLCQGFGVGVSALPHRLQELPASDLFACRCHVVSYLGL
jgi:hypothetical protein